MNRAGPGEAEWKDDVRVLIDEAGSVVNLIVNNNIEILTSIASFVNFLGLLYTIGFGLETEPFLTYALTHPSM